jgi:hypothetical protein
MTAEERRDVGIGIGSAIAAKNMAFEKRTCPLTYVRRED